MYFFVFFAAHFLYTLLSVVWCNKLKLCFAYLVLSCGIQKKEMRYISLKEASHLADTAFFDIPCYFIFVDVCWFFFGRIKLSNICVSRVHLFYSKTIWPQFFGHQERYTFSFQNNFSGTVVYPHMNKRKSRKCTISYASDFKENSNSKLVFLAIIQA